jgi:uncharacterized membrane protein
MESIYKNLTEKKFKIVAILCAFFSDIVIAKYIWSIFSNKELFEKSFLTVMENMEKNPNYDSSMIPKNFFDELFLLWTQSLILMLLAVILVHLVNYLLYSKGKVFSFKYLRIQAWIGGVGLTLAGLPNIANGAIYIALLVAGLGLLFVAFGLRQFTMKNPEPKS